MRFSEWFKKEGLPYGVYLLTGVIIVNALLVFYFRSVVSSQEDAVRKSRLVQPWADRLRTDAAAVDLASHQYMLKQDENEKSQYILSVRSLERDFDSLKYNLKKNDYGDVLIEKIGSGVGTVLASHQHFLEIVEEGDSSTVIGGFHQLQLAFQSVNEELKGIIDSSITMASSTFPLMRTILVLQISLLAGVPLLIMLVIWQRRHHEKLLVMNREIEENNRKYVFNPLDEVDYQNEVEIKTRLLRNLEKAADFIHQVSNGNYTIKWEGINDKNRDVNKENIAGELIRMREQMKNVKEQDEMRLWATEGLSKFGEIIRKNQDNLEVLSDTVISNLVKYIGAKVGGLFILEEDSNGGGKHLQLKACYAYERKKFIQKRIEIGEGIVGQTFLEGQSIHLREVPDEYVAITSGLGETTPKSLLVIPLKANERIEGVLELASLNEFGPHEIEFMEKLAETLASSIISVRTAERTKSLLEVSQQQSEEMRAQEEEMRQNMEELAATQEQMQRQVSDLNKMKDDLESEKFLFTSLMETLPESIFFKDRDSKFIRVSHYLADQHGKTENELVGKSDFDLYDKNQARESAEAEKQIMRTRKPKIDFVEKGVKEDGTEYWVSATKMPLVNAEREVVGTFGISRDVSKLKELESEVLKKEEQLKEGESRYEQRLKQMKDAIAEAEMELEKLRKESQK